MGIIGNLAFKKVLSLHVKATISFGSILLIKLRKFPQIINLIKG